MNKQNTHLDVSSFGLESDKCRIKPEPIVIKGIVMAYTRRNEEWPTVEIQVQHHPAIAQMGQAVTITIEP